MTTDPISTPALTPFELFEALKAKGYQPHPCGQHVERGYCCAQALADAWDDFRNDPAGANEVMKRCLELDRKEVFRVWFGEGPEMKLCDSWYGKIGEAHDAYVAGQLETEVDFILQHR